MAIVQISRIQIRRGLNQDLPQLASAEMGWSIDTQQLYIGNGTFAEGAPTQGVTEILTGTSVLNITSGITSNIATLQTQVSGLQTNVATIQSQIGSPTTVSLGASTSGLIQGITGNDAVITYTINQGGIRQRRGAINFSRIGSTVIYQDDYTETSTSDIVLSVSANSSAASLNYTTTTATTLTYLTSVL
jgi:hypothetical protein